MTAIYDERDAERDGHPPDGGNAQWMIGGSSPKTFTAQIHLTQEQYDLVLMARILDGKSLTSLIEKGLERELAELQDLADYKAAFALRKQRQLFSDERGLR